MLRLRWPDSTNSVSDDPGTLQYRLNQRLIIQQGLFLCQANLRSPFEDNIAAMIDSTTGPERLARITIEAKGHKEIRQRLYRMNMTRASLFPGLDGFAQSLRATLDFPVMLKPDSDWGSA